MHMVTEAFLPQRLGAIARAPSIVTVRAVRHTLYLKRYCLWKPKDNRGDVNNRTEKPSWAGEPEETKARSPTCMVTADTTHSPTPGLIIIKPHAESLVVSVPSFLHSTKIYHTGRQEKRTKAKHTMMKSQSRFQGQTLTRSQSFACASGRCCWFSRRGCAHTTNRDCLCVNQWMTV